MKYQIILNFHLSVKDNRMEDYLEKVLELFRTTFPDANDPKNKPFATVYFEEDEEDKKEL